MLSSTVRAYVHRLLVIVCFGVVVSMAFPAASLGEVADGEKVSAAASTQSSDIKLRPVPAQNGSDVELSCASNCGVNAAYFCLRWFSRDVPLSTLADELNSGELMEQACSFDDLKTVFTKNRLSCVGIKADSIDEILDSISPPSIGIVHLTSVEGAEDVGHFIVIVPLKGEIAIVDPPRKPEVVSVSEARKNARLLRETGEVLIISDVRNATIPSGPLMKLDRDTVDIGRIPIGVNTFEGVVHYENAGSERLAILSSKASCSCMSPPSGDLALEPGRSGSIKVTFDRGKSSAGQNRRSVLLSTNDPSHEHVLVTFTYFLVVIPTTTDANITPRVIDYGRAPAQTIAGTDELVIIRLPLSNENELHQLAFVVENNNPLLDVTRTDELYTEIHLDPEQSHKPGSATSRPAEPDRGLAIVKYLIHWKTPPPSGEFKDQIRFTISGGEIGKRQFDLPLRGEGI